MPQPSSQDDIIRKAQLAACEQLKLEFIDNKNVRIFRHQYLEENTIHDILAVYVIHEASLETIGIAKGLCDSVGNLFTAGTTVHLILCLPGVAPYQYLDGLQTDVSGWVLEAVNLYERNSYITGEYAGQVQNEIISR